MTPAIVENPERVALDVCGRYGVSLEAVKGPGRGQAGFARKVLVKELRSRTAMTLTEVGCFLGGRDHTTILYLLGSKP